MIDKWLVQVDRRAVNVHFNPPSGIYGVSPRYGTRAFSYAMLGEWLAHSKVKEAVNVRFNYVKVTHSETQTREGMEITRSADRKRLRIVDCMLSTVDCMGIVGVLTAA